MSNGKNSNNIETNELITELLSRQRKNVPIDKKLQYTDIKRICKYINSSIFDSKKCCLWNGYITNKNNSTKGAYVNFFFGGEKKALHRLIYINFVGNLSSNEYLKFSCENKGMCCNIHHLKKFPYQKNSESPTEKTNVVKKQEVSQPKHNKVQIITRNTATEEQLSLLYVDFD